MTRVVRKAARMEWKLVERMGWKVLTMVESWDVTRVEPRVGWKVVKASLLAAWMVWLWVRR